MIVTPNVSLNGQSGEKNNYFAEMRCMEVDTGLNDKVKLRQVFFSSPFNYVPCVCAAVNGIGFLWTVNVVSSHRRNAVSICMWILSEAFQFHTIHKLDFYFIIGKSNVFATWIFYTKFARKSVHTTVRPYFLLQTISQLPQSTTGWSFCFSIFNIFLCIVGVMVCRSMTF